MTRPIEVDDGALSRRGALCSSLLVLCAVFGACGRAGSTAGGDGGPHDAPASVDGQCGAGLRAYGPACVPIFDQCGEDEVPLLGGGCKRVGVQECMVEGGAGWGINVYSVEGQASLAVRRSTIARNRSLGIIAMGADADIDASVIAATQPEEATRNIGFGLYLRCRGENTTAGWVCDDALPAPRLTMTRSLVTGNTMAGVALVGAHADIRRSIVRDTVRSPDDNVRLTGAGVHATGAFHPEGLAVALDESIVMRNYKFGVVASGAQLRLLRTLVRDTQLPHSFSATAGKGVVMEIRNGQESSLTMIECQIVGNRHTGVEVSGLATRIERSVIANTGPNDQGSGSGAWCMSWEGFPGTLELEDTVIAQNTNIGLRSEGCEVKAKRVVIRDTTPAADGTGGAGIAAIPLGKFDAQGNPVVDEEGRQWDFASPSRLELEDTLLTRNRFAGLYVFSSSAQVTRSVLRETRCAPRAVTEGVNAYGPGIDVIQHPSSVARELSVSQNVIADNCTAGVALVDSDVVIEGSRISRTRPAPNGAMGVGIAAYALLKAGSLAVKGSLIEKNAGMGISATGVRTEVSACQVRDTRPMPTMVRYDEAQDELVTLQDHAGDAISVEPFVPHTALGWDDGNVTQIGALEVRDSFFERSARVGVSSFDTPLNVTRSLFRDNTIDIYHDGTNALRFEGNVYEGADDAGPVTGLQLTPAAPPALPPEPPSAL